MPLPSPSPRWSPQALTRFGVRALRIAASTVALVELLRQQWLTGALFAAGWLLVIRAERLLPAAPASLPDPDG